MKSPCTRTCADRKVRCRETCERYKPYREWQEAEYRKREKQFMIDDCYALSVERVKRARRIKT